MAYPLIAGWLYAHWWKAALGWIVALVLAVGFLAVGIQLSQDGVGWVVNPVPLLLRYLVMAGPVAMGFFGIGVAARRRAGRR